MIVYYDPIVGETVPDGLIEHWFRTLHMAPPDEITIGSELLLTRIRLGIAESEIEVSQIIWVNPDPDGESCELECNQYGTIVFWPHDCGREHENLLGKLVKVRHEKLTGIVPT